MHMRTIYQGNAMHIQFSTEYYLREATSSFKDGNELDYRLNEIHMCCSLVKNY